MKKYIPILILALAYGCSSNKSVQRIVPIVDSDSRFKNLGDQVAGGSIQGGTFYTDASGKEYVYTVLRGRPAHLLGYELQSLKLITDLELTGDVGSWDLEVSSDGWLYAGGNTGRLFKHRIGSKTVEDVGRQTSGQTVVYDITPGNNGEIFGGTYSGARVFRYHPGDGYTDAGKGPLVKGEDYVRSLDFHPRTGKIYAGIGSHAHLVELDPKTGAKKEFLPAQFKQHEFVYNMAVVPGFSTGDRLFAWLHSGDKQETLIYNLRTGKLDQHTRSIQVKTVIKDPNSNLAYYLAQGKLFSHDFSKASGDAKILAHISDSTGLDAMWGKDGKLNILTVDKHILKYDPKTSKISITDLDVPTQPLKINSLVVGPDGRVWTAGYLAGNHAAYDPKTGLLSQYPGIDQAEGMVTEDTRIYMGVYPTAKIYEYDTKRKWDPHNGNPRLLKQIQGQDRPYPGVSAKDLNKMFFGTVPRYGKLGGTLLEYDKNTDVMLTFKDVVANQSVISLVYAGGSVYGGTTVTGGNGISPTERQAKLFGWDPVSRKKIYETVPVEDAKSITCLINGPDGNIWGVAHGVLFIFDHAKKEVVMKQSLYNTPNSGAAKDVQMAVHPSGMVYGTGGGILFQIDPKTMRYTEIRKGARLLAMAKDGTLYTVIEEKLWEFKP